MQNLNKSLAALAVCAIAVGAIAAYRPPTAGVQPLTRNRGNVQIFSLRESAGRPTPRDARGIYIWHEGDTWFVLSQSEQHKFVQVRAVVRGGTIDNIHRMIDERGDSVRHPSPNTVVFHSTTGDGRDEIRFDVHGGQNLVFDVDQGRGERRPIYVGGSEIRADRQNIVIRLN